MTFDDWYDDYERDGQELLLFNTIDLDAAFTAGHAAGLAMAEQRIVEYCARIIKGSAC